MPLFMSVRACIRAHVSAARAKHGGDGGDAKAAAHYLAVAGQLVADEAPRLIAIGGLSGTGKSTLARTLGDAVGRSPGARILRSDVLRKRLAGVFAETPLPASGYTAEASRATYMALDGLAWAALATGQIHQQEGEIIEDVGRRQLGIEFEAVERRRHTVDRRDIGKMEIAMDMPDAAGLPACIEQATVLIDMRLKPPGKFRDGLGLEDVGIERHRLGIAGDDLADTGRAVARPRDLRLRMEANERVGQLLQRHLIESVPVRQFAPERSVREATHFEDPVRRFAVTIDGERTVLIPCDRMHRFVESRRGSPIELEFGFESHPALVGRGEVEIAQINGALDLPGCLAIQENARRMGVDAADRPGHSESFSRCQPFGQIGRISHGHRSLCLPAAG
ncbi:AAA family ATPase [Sphingobium sp. CECT 9361]|uniref:AAA family ATPase n=1 Tax=Sphingobium sp. CECT 9361 TaxID=2845384 RepID=UPI00339E6DE8